MAHTNVILDSGETDAQVITFSLNLSTISLLPASARQPSFKPRFLGSWTPYPHFVSLTCSTSGC